jgi:hypothetical protein
MDAYNLSSWSVGMTFVIRLVLLYTSDLSVIVVAIFGRGFLVVTPCSVTVGYQCPPKCWYPHSTLHGVITESPRIESLPQWRPQVSRHNFNFHSIQEYFMYKCHMDVCVTAKALRREDTAVARFQSQDSPYGICGGQSGSGALCCHYTSAFT